MNDGTEAKMVKNMENDTKKIISRLVLQKIISAESCKFLSKDSYADLNRRFLDSDPEKDLSIYYRLQGPEYERQYSSGICELHVKWVGGDKETQDPEGNVWNTYQLKMSASINSCWNLKPNEILMRSECISGISALVNDITSLVPDAVQIMVLNNEQRIQREIKRKYDNNCDKISEIIRMTHNNCRSGLRAGGKGRALNRELFSACSPGNYNILINDGSKRTAKIKKYTVTIPENPAYLVFIKRVS